MAGTHRRLVAVGVMAAAIVGTTVAGAGTAHACSCAVPDLTASLLAADVVVHGETVESVDVSPSEQEIDRRFLFRVDERFKGDTPEIIEIRVDTVQGSCDDVVRELWPVQLLEPTVGGWYAYQACGPRPLLRDLAPYFDEPWPLSGRGPPASIVAVPARTHDLAVLDAEGRPLGYLPGPGPTLGVAMCPGGTSFVQLRRTDWSGGPVELAVWQTTTWSEVGTVPVSAITIDPAALPYQHALLTCVAPDGLTSYVGWDTGYDVVGSAVTPRPPERWVFAPGNGSGSDLVLDGGGLAVTSPDPSAPWTPVTPDPTGELRYVVTAATVLPTGWRVTAIQDRFPDSPLIVTKDIGLDGRVRQISSAKVGIELYGWAGVAIDPAVAATLTAPPAASPVPLLERSGSIVDAAAPTLPTVTGASTAPSSTPPAVVDTATVSVATEAAPAPSDDGSSPGWIVPAVSGVALVAGAFVLARRRRTSLPA